MNAFYFCLIAAAGYPVALFVSAIWKDLMEVMKASKR